MTLHCPHCGSVAAHDRQSLLGRWLVCPACYGHFAWREAAPAVLVERPERRSGTILLAEDDDAQRSIAQHALEKLGYRVIAAVDGQQALLLYDAHQHEIDLIFSDMMMPKTGGPELYHAVRERNQRVKFVFASASTAAEVEEYGGVRGVPFIQKPWSLTQLAHLLRETLGAA